MCATNNDRICRQHQGWCGWPLQVVFWLHLLASGAAGQNIGQGASPGGAAQGSPSAGTAAEGPGQDQSRGGRPGGPASLSGVLPSVFKKRHLVSRFSVGQAYEKGISNSNLSQAEDTYTEASASFLYELNGKHSDYTFDYGGSARRYNRFSSLDILSHEAGFGQIVRWSPRLTTSFLYRYSFTGDFPGALLQESVAQELSLMSPGPVSRPMAIPVEQGLVTLRSVAMTNRAQVELSYQLSLYTWFSIRGSASRLRYQDDNLFGNEHARIAASAERSLSPRTVVGIAYEGTLFHQPGGIDRTIVHSGNLSLSRQLTPHMTASISGGRWWFHSEGKDVIPLSLVLSDLVGKPALVRDTSQSFVSWGASANLLWQFYKVNFGFVYSRGVMAYNLLGRPADTQRVALNFGKRLGESATFSASLDYWQNAFFTLRDSRRLDQGVLQVSFARKLISGMDFSIFCNYAKTFQGLERPSLLNHTQAGVRFVLHLPRVRPS